MRKTVFLILEVSMHGSLAALGLWLPSRRRILSCSLRLLRLCRARSCLRLRLRVGRAGSPSRLRC